MKQVVSTEKVPIKMWLDDIEDGALAQAKNLANLPFIFKHVAIMPDAHQGYGMPIGGVMATEGVIIPNAVGVDIGCGVRAMRTSIYETCLTEDVLKKIMSGIRERIPVGFNKHKDVQVEVGRRMPLKDFRDPVIDKEYNNALKSIGTLGGGNHFIELQLDNAGILWIMIHSGSRNLGYKVAKHYNEVAIEANKDHLIVPEKWELAGLLADTDIAHQYLRAMNFCRNYARANRELMMCNVKIAIDKVLGQGVLHVHESVDIPHNYVRLEEHFGKLVWIHRKGATAASKGKKGIIPGSQGTCSYIVKGTGCEDSFKSCSHGAGRLMSRTKAKKTLDLAEEQEKLNSQCIIHGIRSAKDLDEAAGAYKDIDVVMSNQEDLVEILYKLRPIAGIKG